MIVITPKEQIMPCIFTMEMFTSLVEYQYKNNISTKLYPIDQLIELNYDNDNIVTIVRFIQLMML